MSRAPVRPTAICVDASVLMEVLLGAKPGATWADGLLRDSQLIAPELVRAEVVNVLRRSEANGLISSAVASLSFVKLRALPLTCVRFDGYAERIWDLRHNVSVYDAWYVAVAERYDVPLMTLDRRLTSAPGPRCEFLTPPR